MLLIMNYVTQWGLCLCCLLWIMLLNEDFVYVTYYELCYSINTCLCCLLWIMLLNQDFVYVTYYELCYSMRTLFMLLIMNYVTQWGLCLCCLLWIMLLNQVFVYVAYYELCYSIRTMFMLLIMKYEYVAHYENCLWNSLWFCAIYTVNGHKLLNIRHPRFYGIYFI